MRSESQREQLAGPQCVATLVGCLLAFLPALAGSVLAQEPNAGELVNYPFFYGSGSDSGLGAYAVGDRTVQMLTIRPRPMLRSPWKHSWGLRLRLTATLGYYDFEDLEQTIASFRTVAFVPGVEVLFPLSSRSLLYPYIDLGVGSNESRTGLVFVGALGVGSEFVFPLKRFEIGLEPKAQVAVSRASEESLEEDFGGIGLRSDIRHPLAFRILGETAELAGYAGIGWYLRPLTFPTSLASTPYTYIHLLPSEHGCPTSCDHRATDN